MWLVSLFTILVGSLATISHAQSSDVVATGWERISIPALMNQLPTEEKNRVYESQVYRNKLVNKLFQDYNATCGWVSFSAALVPHKPGAFQVKYGESVGLLNALPPNNFKAVAEYNPKTKQFTILDDEEHSNLMEPTMDWKTFVCNRMCYRRGGDNSRRSEALQCEQ